jgi:hypothetical protein
VFVRLGVLLATAVACGGCSLAPQLAPTAAGCYAVQLDSFPVLFSAIPVTRPPTLVQLDPTYGGVIRVPVEWRAPQGVVTQFAELRLRRPSWRIADGEVVAHRVRPTPLPPDSLVVEFSGEGLPLTAMFGAEATGDWRGQAFVISVATPRGQPLVGLQLQRVSCGAAAMALSP